MNAKLFLQPKTFSYAVDNIMAMCKASFTEIRDCLVPSAQHGLIPKLKLNAKADPSQLGLLPVLHRSGLLLDPLLVACEVTECSVKAFTFSKAKGEPFKQDHCASDGRCCYLVPSCLNEEPCLPSLPQYCAITPLAFRSPGCHRKDIPLSVFYQLVAYLMCRFPSSAKCRRYAARFHTGLHHMLDIIYAEMYFKVVVYVYGKEKADSSVTSHICVSVRTMISEHLKTSSKAAGSLVLHPAVLIEDSTVGCPDFVDLHDVNPLGAEQELSTVSGFLFSPSDDFFLWFGRSGRVQQQCNVVYSMHCNKGLYFYRNPVLFRRNLLT